MNPPTTLILLDTNVLVHLIRNRTVGQRVTADHALRDRPERPLISVITVGELLALARKFEWGEEKRRGIRSLLSNLVVVNLFDHLAPTFVDLVSIDAHTGETRESLRS